MVEGEASDLHMGAVACMHAHASTSYTHIRRINKTVFVTNKKNPGWREGCNSNDHHATGAEALFPVTGITSMHSILWAGEEGSISHSTSL